MREGEFLCEPEEPLPDLHQLDVPFSPEATFVGEGQQGEQREETDPRMMTGPQDVSAIIGNEDVCRICLEPPAPENRLLHPCKCIGSIRFIHEECLKAWLSSQAEDMAEACCELCKTPFSMSIKLSRKCTPREACTDGLTQCLFAPLLLAVLGMLILIVYLLSDKYLANADSAEQRGYTAALVVTCLVSALVIVYLLFRTLREACCSRKLTEWIIRDYETSETEVDRIIPETKPAGDVSSFPTHLDLKPDSPLEEARELVPPILVLPKRIKVGGIRVKTPQVHSSSLTPVNQRGRQVAVTPRMFAFPASLSQSRASLNPTPRNWNFGGVMSPAMRWTPDVTMDRPKTKGTVVPMHSESLFQVDRHRP